MTIVPAPRPCGSCPYRRDVPSGVWDESEYRKLLAYDDQGDPSSFAPFLCHQQDGRLCAGWVGVHDMENSIGLRLLAMTRGLSTDEVDAICDYDTDVPLFASGAEAAAHGLAELEHPSPSARILIERLTRKLERSAAVKRSEARLQPGPISTPRQGGRT